MIEYNLHQLNDYVERGLLTKCEDEDLVQYTYTNYCETQSLWDEITAFNRGNIYEKKTGRLIARSMPKFMNFSQLPQDRQEWFLSHGKFVTTEKKDGCLGILYMYKGQVRYNSRCSFNNFVTESIKDILPKYIMIKRMLAHNTLIVEVISPATKIICDYKDEQELYLLTAYDSGHNEYDEKSLDTLAKIITMPRPKRCYMGWYGLFNWCKTANYEQEGYVACVEEYDNTNAFYRVKLKSEDYLRVAKVKANLCKHTVWKLMKNDLEQNTNTLQQFIYQIPDEFLKVGKKYIQDLNNELEVLEKEVQQEYEKLHDIEIRDFNNYFKENPSKYQSCMYSLRNGKEIKKILIKMIEPQQGINIEDLK